MSTPALDTSVSEKGKRGEARRQKGQKDPSENEVSLGPLGVGGALLGVGEAWVKCGHPEVSGDSQQSAKPGHSVSCELSPSIRPTAVR